MKVCSQCGKRKPLSAFYPNRQSVRPECKECSKVAAHRKSEPVVQQPSRDSWFDLGLEYRREVYDPYRAKNRYLPGVRV